MRATTTTLYASASINTAAGDAQFTDVLRRLSVKFSYLREVWRIAKVRTAVIIGSEVHSGGEREKLCQ